MKTNTYYMVLFRFTYIWIFLIYLHKFEVENMLIEFLID